MRRPRGAFFLRAAYLFFFFLPHTLLERALYDNLQPMSKELVKNCTSEEQLEKIRKGLERKFRWRDDWPAMEQTLLEQGNAAIRQHQNTLSKPE